MKKTLATKNTNTQKSIRAPQQSNNITATAFKIANQWVQNELAKNITATNLLYEIATKNITVPNNLSLNIILESLIKIGANLNATDSDGFSIIHWFLFTKNLDFVNLLIGHGVNLDAKNHFKATLLHSSALNGNIEVGQLLMEKGANVNAIDIYGHTPLDFALDKGNLEMVKFLLKNGGIAKTAAANKMTTLHFSIEKGHIKIAEYLIDHKLNINARNKFKQTPLHYAIEKGHINIAKCLIEKGAILNAKDANGHTPLHWASMNKNLEMVQLLLKNGADLNVQDKDGHTPLHWASNQGHETIVQFIQAHLKTTFLSTLDSEINRLKKVGDQEEIANLFNSPISLENVNITPSRSTTVDITALRLPFVFFFQFLKDLIVPSEKNATIILLNNHLYKNLELNQLAKPVCPITRIEIEACDKLDITTEIKQRFLNLNATRIQALTRVYLKRKPRSRKI